MNSGQISESNCIPTIKLLGDFWTLRIIGALKDGELRYCGIQRATDDLNPVTLTARLKKLEEAHLVERIQESRAEVRYRLTALGQQTLPVLDALDAFSLAAETYAEA